MRRASRSRRFEKSTKQGFDSSPSCEWMIRCPFGSRFSGNARIADVLVKYLFDLTIPAEGFSCPGRPIQFGAPAAQKGIDGKQLIEDLERGWLWRPGATSIRKGN